MLGEILRDLTDARSAEALLEQLDRPALLERIRAGAAERGVAPGAFAASAVRRFLDHANEEVWLNLLGRMARTPQPGAAALEAILAQALADPAR